MSPPRTEEKPRPSAESRLSLLRRSYNRFVRIRGNPHEIALGLSLGIFVGLTPYMGVQMAIAVCVAALLKWNKIAAAMGVWISNPLSAPFLYSVTYVVGARILQLESPRVFLPTNLSMEALMAVARQTPGVIWTLTVGGVIVGLPLAVGAYFLALKTICRYRCRMKTLLKKGHPVDCD